MYKKSEAKAYAREHMRGVWGAIPYPFKSNGELDEGQIRKDVRYYVDRLKLDGLFCGGLVGECWSLTLDERKRGQEIVVSEVARSWRIPVASAFAIPWRFPSTLKARVQPMSSLPTRP